MPELPEVETTKAGISPAIVGQSIAKVIIRAPKLRWPIPNNIKKILPGQIIHSVERRAKYLLLKCDIGTLIMHLGMSGRLRVLTDELAPEKHDHFDLCFKNGVTMRYTDPRRFGAILWTKHSPLEHKLLVNLGPEPFAEEFNGEYLANKAHNKKASVKVFIMDAKVVVGVGNIYASEALFAAKIDPRKPANLVSTKQYTLLVKHIKRILQESIKQGGTTLKDFYNATGKPGYFSQKLKVYGREKLPCNNCKNPISAINIGQRNTFFCEECQS